MTFDSLPRHDQIELQNPLTRVSPKRMSREKLFGYKLLMVPESQDTLSEGRRLTYRSQINEALQRSISHC